jgi:hypothetical protein
MLLTITGSSCSGKTTAVRACGPMPGIVWHDFDEIGVPDDAGTAWRHRGTEQWIRRALDYQARGLDMLLTGQSPLGEVLACPSADHLDGILACLLDVDDEVRRRRLRERGVEPDAFIGWARWQRAHAADPRYRPEVITTRGWEPRRWDRWSDWTGDDPRWAVTVIDTTGRPVAESAGDIRRWAETRHRQRGPNQDSA